MIHARLLAYHTKSVNESDGNGGFEINLELFRKIEEEKKPGTWKQNRSGQNKFKAYGSNPPRPPCAATAREVAILFDQVGSRGLRPVSRPDLQNFRLTA